MKILSIETSCDETGAAIVEKKESKVTVLADKLSSSSQLHAKTGGIIPEFAAREQIKSIIPLIVDALLSYKNIPFTTIEKKEFQKASNILREDIDKIAVTYGPGLIGSLLVGVETAKTLSLVYTKPIIPVNHLIGHLYANFIHDESGSNREITFPFIGLIVSGGHTDLLYFTSHKEYTWLGGTRDDAAGEALDKIGRLLDLSYPAGPEIEKRASRVKNPSIIFHSPLIHEKTYDFSFSGLKTEVLRYVQKEKNINEELKDQICFAVQKAIIDVLVSKTLSAAEQYKVTTILLGGGVSANLSLLNTLTEQTSKRLYIHIPLKKFCTDNASMIGARACFETEIQTPLSLRAHPDLYFA